VAMAYQWETNSKGHVGSPAGWIDAAQHADAVGIDICAPQWDFHPIRKDRGFRRWATEIVEASGKPWGVIERGISGHAGGTARTDILADDWHHLTTTGATMLLYWQADWTGGNGKLKALRKPRSTAASPPAVERADPRSGCSHFALRVTVPCEASGFSDTSEFLQEVGTRDA
jgi:hypothetical protein